MAPPVDKLEDLVREGANKLEHKERLGEMAFAVTKVVLEVVATIRVRIKPSFSIFQPARAPRTRRFISSNRYSLAGIG